MKLRDALYFAALLLLVTVSARGQQCGENAPAFPVPEFREGTRLWPPGFRPGLPGQQLPDDRDSTQYRTFSRPNVTSGHELVVSLDIAGDRLYVAYGLGLQAWDIGGLRAESPVKLTYRDGTIPGHFLDFPGPGEDNEFIHSVSAISLAGRDLIALSGTVGGPGPSVWRFAGGQLEQLYQDRSGALGTDSMQVRIIEHGGRGYALSSGSTGLVVYDVTAAESLPAPCLDGVDSCPGVRIGKVGQGGEYLDLIEESGVVYVATSAGNAGGGVVIWAMDPAAPTGAQAIYRGLGDRSFGLAWVDSRYLGVVESPALFAFRVSVYDFGACLAGGACEPSLVATWPGHDATRQMLTRSMSGVVPYLYYGPARSIGTGGAREALLDVSDPTSPVEITAGGGTYADACNGSQVDYWGDYYEDNDHGLRNVAPHVGRFNGAYFYRAANGVLDVHCRTTEGGACPPVKPPDPIPRITVSCSPASVLVGETVTCTATAANCPADPTGWTITEGKQ